MNVEQKILLMRQQAFSAAQTECCFCKDGTCVRCHGLKVCLYCKETPCQYCKGSGKCSHCDGRKTYLDEHEARRQYEKILLSAIVSAHRMQRTALLQELLDEASNHARHALARLKQSLDERTEPEPSTSALTPEELSTLLGDEKDKQP